MNLLYLPWNMGAQAVKDLKEFTGGLTIYPETSRSCTKSYRYKPTDAVVIWGHGAQPYWGAGVKPSKRILNHWSVLPGAINKLKTFKLFKEAGDVPSVEWTASMETAANWIKQGHTVLCRQKLTSREGDGIVIAKKVVELVGAPLYTKFVRKDKEYRVHVFKGEVIDYTQKKLRKDADKIQGRDKYIRNTANGWVFCRQGVEINDATKDAAKRAIAAVGLDFGAVDLATTWDGGVIVFEVNTAPGIEGTTIKRYAEAIEKWQKTL